MPLQYTKRALQVLRAVNAVLESASSEQRLLDEVCRIAVQVGGYRFAWLGYALHDKAKTVRFMAHAGQHPDYLQQIKITWDDTPTGRGPAGIAIRTRQPYIVRFIAASTEFSPWREKALEFGYNSVIALPLAWHDDLFGCIAILSSEPDAFDEDEADLLSELASSVSYGINALRTQQAHELATLELRTERDTQEVLRRILSLSLEQSSLEEKLHRTLELLFNIPWLSLEHKGSVFLVNEGSTTLRLAARRYLSPVLHELCATVPFDRCLCGKAAASGQLIYKMHVDDEHETRFPGIVDHGHYCQPIRSARGVLGVLNLYIAPGHVSTTRETNFLAAVADTLAGVIEREQAVQAQQRLVALLEATPDPVTITDTAGKSLYANSSAQHFLSLPIASTTAQQCLFDSYTAATAQFLNEVAYPLARQTGRWEGELELHAMNGQRMHASLLIMSHCDTHGDIAYISTTARDISDRLRAEQAAQALAVRERHFANSLINSLPGIFYLIDSNGRLIRWNKNLEAMLGYNEQRLTTMSLKDLIPADGWHAMQQTCDVIMNEGSGSIELELLDQDGMRIPYYITGTLIEGGGTGQAIAGVGIDISYRKQLERELLQRATVDMLTGTYNRLKMEETLEHELNRSRRYNSPLSIAMFDIDYFKRVNDTYGHDVGDEVLQAFAAISRSQLREVDLLARWGGEEFMIISAETSLEDMYKLAERIRSAVESSQSVSGIHITASFGVGQFRAGETQKEFIKRVDDALYEAKNSGRNQVRIAG